MIGRLISVLRNVSNYPTKSDLDYFTKEWDQIKGNIRTDSLKDLEILGRLNFKVAYLTKYYQRNYGTTRNLGREFTEVRKEILIRILDQLDQSEFVPRDIIGVAKDFVSFFNSLRNYTPEELKNVLQGNLSAKCSLMEIGNHFQAAVINNTPLSVSELISLMEMWQCGIKEIQDIRIEDFLYPNSSELYTLHSSIGVIEALFKGVSIRPAMYSRKYRNKPDLVMESRYFKKELRNLLLEKNIKLLEKEKEIPGDFFLTLGEYFGMNIKINNFSDLTVKNLIILLKEKMKGN